MSGRVRKEDSVWPRHGDTWKTHNNVTFKPLFFEDIKWPINGLSEETVIKDCNNVSVTVYSQHHLIAPIKYPRQTRVHAQS